MELCYRDTKTLPYKVSIHYKEFLDVCEIMLLLLSVNKIFQGTNRIERNR